MSRNLGVACVCAMVFLLAAVLPGITAGPGQVPHALQSWAGIDRKRPNLLRRQRPFPKTRGRGSTAPSGDPEAGLLLHLQQVCAASLRMIVAACDGVPDAGGSFEPGTRSQVLANARRMGWAADQALDLALVSGARLVPRLRLLDVGVLIGWVVDVFRRAAGERGLRIDGPKLRGRLDWVVDAVMVEKVLSRLLAHAIVGAAGGTVVTVDAGCCASALRIGVVGSDRPGLPVANGSACDSEWPGAAGVPGIDLGWDVGFVLCRRLVELHGGEFHVSAPESGGFRLGFELPRHHCDADPEPYEGFGEIAARECECVLGVGTGARRPDDVPPLAMVVRLSGQSEAPEVSVLRTVFAVETVDTAALAESRIESMPPDLVILCVAAWPGGASPFLMSLRRKDATRCTPVMVLAQAFSGGDRLSAVAAGADDLLPLPIDAMTLRRRCLDLVEDGRRFSLLRKRAASVPTGGAQARRCAWLGKLKRIVDEHLHDDGFGVGELADRLHTSRSQLFRRVKAATGMSPREYISDARLLRAAALLERKAGSVSEIVLEVGYSSLAHFSRSFRRRFGVPPSEYPGTAA